MSRWLKNLLDDPTDPVKHCDLYRDKAAGSCSHVDGPLCDFPGCSMLADYRAAHASGVGELGHETKAPAGTDGPGKGSG